MAQFKVYLGTNGRNRSTIVEADDKDAAVLAAVEKLVSLGEEREWCEAKAANRQKLGGTCSVEAR